MACGRVWSLPPGDKEQRRSIVVGKVVGRGVRGEVRKHSLEQDFCRDGDGVAVVHSLRFVDAQIVRECVYTDCSGSSTPICHDAQEILPRLLRIYWIDPSVDDSEALRAKIRHSSRITGNPEHSRLGLRAPSATAFDRSRPSPPVRLHSETHFPAALCVSTRAHDLDIVSPCETSTSFQPLRPWQPSCSPQLKQATLGHVLH
jgi:hypothetical protein